MLVTSPLRWLGGKIDVRVEVETLAEGGGVWDEDESGTGWDEAAWAVFEWQDITQYVQDLRISRGQPRWESRFKAGSLTLKLNNITGLFSPEGGADLDALVWRPGRAIRVYALPDPTDDENRVFLFTGRIDDTRDAFYAASTDVVATVRALDALADLHAFNPPALETATGVQGTHDRVHAALDRMEWPEDLRLVQPGLHTMQTSFLAQTTLEEVMRAAEAEGGAVYADTQNRVTFRNRDWELATAGLLFKDDFSSALDPENWPDTHDVSVSGGQLVVPGPGTDWAESKTLTLGDRWQATIELVEAGMPPTEPTGGSYKDITFQVADFVTGIVRFYVYADNGTWPPQLFAEYRVPPTNFVVVQAEYDPVAHRWLRLARDGDTYSWLTSPSGTGPWTLFAESDAPTVPDEAVVYIVGDGTASGSTSSLLDNLRAELLGVDSTRSTTVQGYLGYDSGQEGGVPYASITDIKTSWETARIRNDVQFARVGSGAYRAQDTDSQILYGRRTHQRLDFQNNSDAQIEFLAERYLAAYKDLRLRVDSVTIAANDDPDNEDLNRLFYATDFGDLLQVNLDTGHGWGYVRQGHVIGIDHHITPDDWTVTFTLDDAALAIAAEESSS